jgi:DNA-binding transcriptional ArsR family regulator
MAALPLDELNQLHADICQALADPKRILILYALAEEARNVSTLACDLGLAQPTVSRHLRVLRQQSLVGTRRDGPSVIYYLSDQRIIAVLDTMQQLMLDALERQTELLTAA